MGNASVLESPMFLKEIDGAWQPYTPPADVLGTEENKPDLL